MRRPYFLAAGAVAILTLAGGATAATQLNSSNSVSFRFGAKSLEQATGIGCGTTAIITKSLPAGSSAIDLIEPKVGARDNPDGTQVTAVSVAGTVITISVLADGPNICDPAMAGGPVDQVQWMARYTVRSDHSRRIQVPLRVNLASTDTKTRIRPKTVWNGDGPTGVRFTGLKWKRFGSKKATGIGRLRLDYCKRGDNCPENGKRIKLVVSNAGLCQFSGNIEYRKVTGYVGGRLYFSAGTGGKTGGSLC